MGFKQKKPDSLRGKATLGRFCAPLGVSAGNPDLRGGCPKCGLKHLRSADGGPSENRGSGGREGRCRGENVARDGSFFSFVMSSKGCPWAVRGQAQNVVGFLRRRRGGYEPFRSIAVPVE